MDKLEQYLDQVCRTIGGPPQMREHLRQELREHLLDAIAQHKTAGMPDDAALAKALDEFGRPEEVRSDLEAAHGQRRWFIDKALEWKEMTMRAKWLWMTWAYLAVILVILLTIAWISFANVFITPKFQKLTHDGIIDSAVVEESGVAFGPAFLVSVKDDMGNPLWYMIAAALLWGLFEWRVKSENKSWMRLSALGTAAVVLLVIGVLMAATFVVIFCLGAPAIRTIARPWAIEQVTAADTHLQHLERAVKATPAKWDAANVEANQLSGAMTRLSQGPGIAALGLHSDAPKLRDLRSSLDDVRSNVRDAQAAIEARDAQRVEASLAKARAALGPLQDAAKKPTP